MDINKTLKHFRLLTPTAEFRQRVINSGTGASALHARIVYSWLAYRSRHNFGATTRSVCAETGLHPATTKKALSALGDLVERQSGEWVALEPKNTLFVSRTYEKAATHWSDRYAYSILYLPRKGAKVVYPEMTLRFGLNHAIVWSHIVRSSKKEGMMRRFTMAGTAALFGIDEKTVRSVVGDLVWLRLVQRVDLGSSSEMTPLAMTEEHLTLFEPKPKPTSKLIEPEARKPRPSVNSYKLLGDRWDECRHLCRGFILQERAEEMFKVARRLGDSPESFINEFYRVKTIYDDRVLNGKVAGGNFGGYLRACFNSRLGDHEEQERRNLEEQRVHDLLSNPEYQQRLSDERKAAEADPLHPKFIMSDDAIHNRVSLGDSPVMACKTLDKLKYKLHWHVKSFVAAKNLYGQHEMDVIGSLKSAIQSHALALLNAHYKQPVLASREEFEQAIDRAIAELEPTMPPMFGQA